MQPKPYVLTTDQSLIVLSKPRGMSVHATNPGENEGTLVEWITRLDPYLEQRFPKVAGEIWRPGIVHRLDKDTSGLMVIARTPEALQNLQDQFRGRSVRKVYRALVAGAVDESGEFAGAIARSDEDPTRQTIRRLSFSWSKGNAREAETSYRRLGVSGRASGTLAKWARLGEISSEVKETHGSEFASLVELNPKTGRMHQLRVQLADAGWPILGDERYETKTSRKLSDELGTSRQLLHAMRLEFDHPETGERKQFCMGYPHDFLKVLNALELPTDSCEDQP